MRANLAAAMLVLTGGFGLATVADAAPKKRSVVEVQTSDGVSHPAAGY